MHYSVLGLRLRSSCMCFCVLSLNESQIFRLMGSFLCHIYFWLSHLVVHCSC